MSTIKLYNISDWSITANDVCEYLNEDDHQKIKKSRVKIQQDLALKRRVVIKLALSERIQCNPKSLVIAYDNQGKPFTPEYPKTHWNVSYTSDLVAVGFSEYSIGVDIELSVGGVDYSSIREQFFPKFFLEQSNTIDNFWWGWVTIESVLKEDGRGLMVSPTLLHAREFNQDISLTSSRSEAVVYMTRNDQQLYLSITRKGHEKHPFQFPKDVFHLSTGKKSELTELRRFPSLCVEIP